MIVQWVLFILSFINNYALFPQLWFYGGWILFALWLIPLLLRRGGSPSYVLMYGSLILGLAGLIFDLNIFKNLGLAVILASFTPLSFPSLLWLGSAFFWLPSSPWILNKISLNYDWVKYGGLIILSLPLLYGARTREK